MQKPIILRRPLRLKAAALKQIWKQLNDVRVLNKAPDCIMVYQMGKVGSTSVHEGLLASNFNALQVHRVSKDFRKENQKDVESTGTAFQFVDILGKAFEKKLRRMQFKGKIITLVRDPLSRNISEFFHSIERFIVSDSSNPIYTMEELKDLFLENYCHDFQSHWYEKDFLTFFPEARDQLDLTHVTHQFMKLNNIDLLFLKSECPRDEMATIISDFVSSLIQLPNTNVGSESRNGGLYSEFKKTVRFDKEWLDAYYERMKASRFYNESEIERFKTKWLASEA